MRMPFGKYKGRTLENIPREYLEYILSFENLSDYLKFHIKEVFTKWDKQKKKKRNK